ncbi:MAG: hypothetical protein RL030_2419 [Pseudomonadota bacterium]
MNHPGLLARFVALALLAGCGGSDVAVNPPPGPAPIVPPVPPAAQVTTAEAFRFLNQASFGATSAEAQRLIALGDATTAYSRWIDSQVALAPSLHLPTVLSAYDALAQGTPPGSVHADRVEVWLRHAVTAPDQLRQRVAFALSEIMVISQVGGLQQLPLATTDYYDILVRNAFGNYRRLLEDVTLSPAMGVYLSMLGNEKPDVARNIRPDENYAREAMQLFTVGLVELSGDGSVRLDGQGQALPTYNQEVIEGFANVYTGWKWAWTGAGAPSFTAVRPGRANQMLPMQVYPERHSTGTKRLLGATVLPAGQTPQKDLADALDSLFAHPNVGPFIARQLIQRLVTSNPSPAYVGRVAAVFNNDGSGARGNLAAVVRSILLDSEARSAPATDTAGKMKEPLLRLTQLWRAFDARATNGRFLVQPANTFGQGPLQAPSVFNFFSPGYGPPGEIADRNLVAPELQIATEYLNTSVTNYLYNQVFGRTSAVPGQPDTAVVLDVSAELAVIGDSATLVDRIAGKLLGGQISATLRSQARTLVESRTASDPQRVAEALYLVVTSPEFALQR